ncbi:hypothetical protein ACFSTC_04820 [Nonomuraea ferruginea]
MDLEFVSRHAGRPAAALTRRDLARALLAVPSGVALVALPDLRRAMMAAGNPLSRPFWESARTTLAAIESGAATVGDVQRWVESTGTEPILMTPSYFVWPEENERGPIAHEMHDRLVAHLEERVRAGEIDPDALASGDLQARRAYEELQESWLATPLPDGRVPGFSVSDEQDEELFAAWDEEEEFALSELRRILGELVKQPELPIAELDRAVTRLRELLAVAGYPGNVLRACAGFEGEPMPDDDVELWLTVAARRRRAGLGPAGGGRPAGGVRRPERRGQPGGRDDGPHLRHPARRLARRRDGAGPDGARRARLAGTHRPPDRRVGGHRRRRAGLRRPGLDREPLQAGGRALGPARHRGRGRRAHAARLVGPAQGAGARLVSR